MPYHDDMTDQEIPHPSEQTDRLRRQVWNDPTTFANDLADQHFAEALDMLIENAREVLVDTIYEDLRMTIPPGDFERLLGAYHDRLAKWFDITPTTFDPEEG